VAEAQAVLTGEKAGFLRDRQGPVHPERSRERAAATDASNHEASGDPGSLADGAELEAAE